MLTHCTNEKLNSLSNTGIMFLTYVYKNNKPMPVQNMKAHKVGSKVHSFVTLAVVRGDWLN